LFAGQAGHPATIALIVGADIRFYPDQTILVEG
jgi:hypothetical protein